MRRVAAAAALALVVGVLAEQAVVLAAGPSVEWGTPSASGRFGQGLSFTQPVTVRGTSPSRVEILVTVPGAVGPLVVDESDLAATSSGTYRYSMDASNGGLLPNTVVSARWRVTAADGTSAVGPSVSVTYADDRFDWQTKSGSLVRIHWYRGDQAFGERALSIAERGVAQAEQLLGVTETEPIDFFVYADQQAFYDALGPGTRENVGGEAVSEIRTLFGLITPAEVNASWVGIVIPHELTHLVFDTAVHNSYHFPPRWLNEGLAVYLNGTELPAETYKRHTIQSVEDEIERLLDGEGHVFSHWRGPGETALYVYGPSFAEMSKRLDAFLRSNPLCDRCRVEQIA